MRTYLFLKPLPGNQLVHRFQKRLAAAYPLALSVFHVGEGLLLFHAESIARFADLISASLGRVHTTQSDTNNGQINKSRKHAVKFIVTGECPPEVL
jgi:hypothetical protein